MSDKLITQILHLVFSVPSILIHTLWFVLWFCLSMDVNLLTNIVSLEAIYVGILVGIQQVSHHESIKDHISKKEK